MNINNMGYGIREVPRNDKFRNSISDRLNQQSLINKNRTVINTVLLWFDFNLDIKL